jgi:hypothetical protein
VWVGSVTHRRLNWLPGIIESAVSSVSYRVICNNRVRHVSSSHLRRRSEGAACLEVDPEAVDVDQFSDPRTPPRKTAGPPWGKPLSELLQPVPVPVPQQLAHGDAQATPDKLPSPQRSEVPIPRAVRTPLPVVRSPPQKEFSPEAPMPAKVSPLTPATPVRPLVSRRVHPIIPPKGLMDYIFISSNLRGLILFDCNWLLYVCLTVFDQAKCCLANLVYIVFRLSTQMSFYLLVWLVLR